jgi:hypothetical protein
MTNRDQGIKHLAEIQGTISFGRLGCRRKNNIEIVLRETRNDSDVYIPLTGDRV